ncbi:MAG TPA: aromatic ring-hydroxylating dioxygenase subunit alpha [Burkholderiales bacterium]|nr:aromatic ring-hydroxylating dioxygenase subunit alpha [Burkholderiales bacterium]
MEQQTLAEGLAATCLPLAEARTLPRRVYTDPEVYAAEARALFARMWLCIGREEDLPDTGSFLTQVIGDERILVLRGDDGELRAFFNVCRHRGSRLVEEPCGRLRGALSCPYHAWTYALDGRLLRAPRAEPGFRTEDFPLTQARLDVLGGFVFVNLDHNGPALGEALADLPDLGRYRLAELRRARLVEYEVAANWKVVAENYSECYHCALVHPQLNRISDMTSGFFQSGACFNGGPMQLREGFTTMSMTGATALAPIAGLPEADHRLVSYYLVYPNLMLGLHPQYVLVHRAWPLAPDRTRVVCEWLFPQESLTAPGFDPADMVDFWGLTNRQDWALCERVQRGAASAGYVPGPYHPTERCVHAFDKWYAEAIAQQFAAATS